MTLIDMLFSLENTEILNRMAQLYPEWFEGYEVDFKADFLRLLDMLRCKNYDKISKDEIKGEVIFMVKFEDRWNLPEHEEYKPFTYELFTLVLNDTSENCNIPYGMVGYKAEKLFLLDIYPPSLELVTNLDFLCHTLNEIGMYGGDLLELPKALEEEYEKKANDENDNSFNFETDENGYINYEFVRDKFLKELDEECEKDPLFKEEMERLDAHLEKMSELYYEYRLKLMDEIRGYYKEVLTNKDFAKTRAKFLSD